MYQDKDRYTYSLNKLDSEDSLCSVHIPVDNPYKGPLDILLNMYIFHRRNVHWAHKVMMHRDQQ